MLYCAQRGRWKRDSELLPKRHSKAVAERPLYCNSQEKTRPEVSELCGHDLADEPSLSENMPPFIQEEELASSSFRLRLRIFQPAVDAQFDASGQRQVPAAIGKRLESQPMLDALVHQ